MFGRAGTDLCTHTDCECVSHPPSVCFGFRDVVAEMYVVLHSPFLRGGAGDTTVVAYPTRSLLCESTHDYG